MSLYVGQVSQSSMGLLGPRTPVVKGLVWFTDGPRRMEGTGTGVNGQSSGRRLSISLGKHPKIFQTELYAILACVYEIQTNARTGKICQYLLIVRWIWKPFRLPKQFLHLYESAKRHWMITLPGTWKMATEKLTTDSKIKTWTNPQIWNHKKGPWTQIISPQT
jgi:hypothetical protein